MKNFFYVGIFVLFVVFGLTAYRQNENAKFFREERNKMHQALIQTRRELQSSKVEVAKLKLIIDEERKNAQKMMLQAQKKKK